MTFDELKTRFQAREDRAFGVGASESEIDDAERTLLVPIVGTYRSFLLEFGWGGVGSFEVFGLGADVPPYLDLVAVTHSERAEMHPPLPRHLIPIMNDGGGNLYCLDSTVSTEPPVVFWDHERGPNQRPEACAENFLEWLASQVDGAE